MARHTETAADYFARTGSLREDDWGQGGSSAPGFGGVLGDVATDMITDMVVNNAVPARGGDQAKRDAKDAGNADTAFSAILAAAVGILLTPAAAGTVLSAGGATPVTATYASIVTGAGVAVRVAWQKLSVADRANIWRGGI